MELTMKTQSFLALLLCLTCSFPVSAQELVIPNSVIVTGHPTRLGNTASIQGVPDTDGVAGVYGRSTTVGVMGASGDGSGVVGTTNNGEAGTFVVYGSGTALHATTRPAAGSAVALKVDGPMVKPRTARNLLKVYNPVTGALVGTFEFEIVQE
jgi:hypothetical protein